MSDMPTRVNVREAGPRDGLQSEDPVSTDAKVELINALSQTGLSRIEVVSFVHPRAIPQMADADDVWARIVRAPSVTYSALVPNIRGAERALVAGFTDVEVVISASDTHNQRNINRTTEESLAKLPELASHVHAKGGSLQLIIATAWGCPYEGDVPLERVLWAANQGVQAGVDSLMYGDTTGMATPHRVTELVDRTRNDHPDMPLGLHFHNTRGVGLVNVYAALELGIRDFDASVGGLGGCPYAPGASGNIATEELVFMLEDMGIETGVDLEALIAVAAQAENFVGRKLPSGVLRAGPRTLVQ